MPTEVNQNSIKKLAFIASLSREEQEALYRGVYHPKRKTLVQDEVVTRIKAEEIREQGASFGPTEYDGDPLAYVRGPDVVIDESSWFKDPDYQPFYDRRERMLTLLRQDQRLIHPLRSFYKTNVAAFITDWGTTYDPRSVNSNRSAFVPFVLFKRQVEWCEWLTERWRAEERGLTEKSRESGVTWLAVAAAVTMCLFTEGMAIGFGSRKAELVDTLGNPDSIFEKIRMFIEALPPEFKGAWNRYKNGTTKRITFPDTNSIIAGEGGDDIGRGGRQSLYFVDEAAHLEHPELAEAALSQTTRCRIDVSTPRGLGNPFEQLAHRLPSHQVFTFHWTADPRKDEAWYAKQKAEAFSPAILAQEVDIDYAASVEGVLIPHAWVLAAFDAHEKLDFPVEGERIGGFDVADEGRDLLAFAVRHGVSIDWIEEWAGRGADIYDSVERAFRICDHFDLPGFKFDSDGLGAGVRGDARKINEHRTTTQLPQRFATPYRGSEAVWMPDAQDFKGRKNKDFFANRKVQMWWALRERFRKTFLALSDEPIVYHPDELITLPQSIDVDQPNMRLKLASELSQVTFKLNNAGKVMIDKAPDGVRSPNLADAIVVAFARSTADFRVTTAHLQSANHRSVFALPSHVESAAPRQIVGSGLTITPSLLRRAQVPGSWTNRGL